LVDLIVFVAYQKKRKSILETQSIDRLCEFYIKILDNT